ncbi:stress responsive protein [Pseudomonas brassicacearum]|uniref:Stress responsive protein n=1 Tax=Pseudomonas brassicacearum TaxID=930166 RepID=A0A423H5U6_9PSED|nr:Dabb family protein [Pseudomonas brassicacearum]RON08578.1 stress responsive protein [Pseudomonas brassicacearum]
MILHLVFFKFDEPFQWCDDEVIDAEASTRQHPLHINEIVGWACGRNISPRKQAMDFVVMGLFETQEALSAFLVHPNHQQGVMKWQKIASWQVVDIDIGSDTTKFVGLLNGWADFGVTTLEKLKTY